MCFSWDWLLHLLIFAILVIATIKILQVVVNYALTKMGGAIGEGWAVIVRVLEICFWAAVAIFVLIICFALLSCLWSAFGGGGMTLLPRR